MINSKEHGMEDVRNRISAFYEQSEMSRIVRESLNDDRLADLAKSAICGWAASGRDVKEYRSGVFDAFDHDELISRVYSGLRPSAPEVLYITRGTHVVDDSRTCVWNVFDGDMVLMASVLCNGGMDTVPGKVLDVLPGSIEPPRTVVVLPPGIEDPGFLREAGFHLLTSVTPDPGVMDNLVNPGPIGAEGHFGWFLQDLEHPGTGQSDRYVSVTFDDASWIDETANDEDEVLEEVGEDLDMLCGTIFNDPGEAREALKDFLDMNSVYPVTMVPHGILSSGNGEYRVSIDVHYNKAKALFLKESNGMFVITTDVPARPIEGYEGIVIGTEELLDLYIRLYDIPSERTCIPSFSEGERIVADLASMLRSAMDLE